MQTVAALSRAGDLDQAHQLLLSLRQVPASAVSAYLVGVSERRGCIAAISAAEALAAVGLHASPAGLTQLLRMAAVAGGVLSAADAEVAWSDADVDASPRPPQHQQQHQQRRARALSQPAYGQQHHRHSQQQHQQQQRSALEDAEPSAGMQAPAEALRDLLRGTVTPPKKQQQQHPMTAATAGYGAATREADDGSFRRSKLPPLPPLTASELRDVSARVRRLVPRGPFPLTSTLESLLQLVDEATAAAVTSL